MCRGRQCVAPHKYTHGALESGFSALGLWVGLYPWYFIAFSTLVTLVCSSGFAVLKTVRRMLHSFTGSLDHSFVLQAVDYDDTWIPLSSIAQVSLAACCIVLH